MKSKLLTLVMLFATCLQITAQASSISTLTDQQKDVKKQIDDVTSKIMNYEKQINKIKSKISANNDKIKELNTNKEKNEKKIDGSRAQLDSTLVLMQKMKNSNTLATYFYDENTLDNNYFLKLDNINALFDSISGDMSGYIQAVEQAQSDINQVNKLKAENKKQLTDMNAKLDKQKELETNLKEQLADVETEIGKVALTTSGGASSSNKQAIMSAAGISASDYSYVDYIISKESGWNATADNPMSSAYGICQALPGAKMASAGSDWQTNPVTQLEWCNSYATSRYGSWAGAYSFWISHHWW